MNYFWTLKGLENIGRKVKRVCSTKQDVRKFKRVQSGFKTPSPIAPRWFFLLRGMLRDAKKTVSFPLLPAFCNYFG